jgi:hypothetical protein
LERKKIMGLGESHWDQKQRNIEERSMSTKETNPKDAVGTKKVPMSCVPLPPLLEVAVAMQEGGRKYGRHNYRKAGVRGSVYFDAAMRHLFAWFEGEDLDPDSGISHVSKAVATLMVLRDAQIRGNWEDDRPPRTCDIVKIANLLSEKVVTRYPDAKAPITEKGLQSEKVEGKLGLCAPSSYPEMELTS